MEVKNLKWYSPFLFLLGAILSFADPITDILTLVKFYHTDHKTWFGVGLAFVILPCLVFSILYCFIRNDGLLDVWPCAKAILYGFHPFSAALARLEGFLFCLKKWWRGDEIDSDGTDKAEDVLMHIDGAVLFEAVLESAPQFILQLYAISVQEEPVTIIQMISLPVSFLSLAWAFTTTDEWILPERGIISSSSDLTVKHKIALYVTYVLLLSSRLFAICYFTVSYKWWVIGVLLFHTCAVVATASIKYRGKVKCNEVTVLRLTLFGGIQCLRDDTVDFAFKENAEGLSIVLFSNVLFVVENFFMILMFYFSPHSNTWYSLPVTVCVCVFSVLGSIMRMTLLLWLRRETAAHSQAENSGNVDISIHTEREQRVSISSTS